MSGRIRKRRYALKDGGGVKMRLRVLNRFFAAKKSKHGRRKRRLLVPGYWTHHVASRLLGGKKA